MNQTLLRMQVPNGSGQSMRGADFREHLARTLERSPNYQKLFHRDTDGKPAEGQPGLRTVSGRNWVGVLAMPGDQNKQALMDAMGAIVEATSQLAGQSLAVGFETREFGVQPLAYPRTYFLREVVIKRRSQKRRNQSDEALVLEVLKHGLARVAVDYGLDLPDETVMDLRITTVQKSLGLRIRTVTGITNEYAQLIDATFTGFVDLMGIWQVGNLKSRGYGRIGLLRESMLAGHQMEVLS